MSSLFQRNGVGRNLACQPYQNPREVEGHTPLEISRLLAGVFTLLATLSAPGIDAHGPQLLCSGLPFTVSVLLLAPSSHHSSTPPL